jgi:hypothetical protein
MAHTLRVLINRFSYYEIHVKTLAGGWLPLVNSLGAERWPLLSYTYAAIVIRHVEAVAPEIPVPSYIMARHMRFPLSLLFNRSHSKKHWINQSFIHTHQHKSASPLFWYMNIGSERDAWIKLPRIRCVKLRIARWLWRKARYFNS